jgi:hypothetical protein
VLAAVSSFVLLGYTLVYAAVANGGSLARDPWLALTHDAYAQGPNGAPSTSTPSTFDQVLGFAGKVLGFATNPVGSIAGLIP